MTVREAADELRITVEAVRGRIKRGTMSHHKASDGTVYVWVQGDPPSDQTATGPQPDDDQPSDQFRPDDTRAELVEELHDRIRYLERQLDVRTDELREHRRLLAGLIERIPELTEAPQTGDGEGRAGAASPSSNQDSQETPGAPQEASGDAARPPQAGQRRSWWRRWLGG